MNEKNFIPGTNPEWGRELPDGDLNSLVDKNGNVYDDGFNFDEKDDAEDLLDDSEDATNEADDLDLSGFPDFDPEAAQQRYDAEKGM